MAILMVACNKTEPVVEQAEFLEPKSAEVIQQTAQFNWDIFNQVNAVAEKGENVVISPISITQALGMAINGATGNNLNEMLALFGLDSRVGLNGAFQNIRAVLASADPKVAMQISNSAWYRQGFHIKQPFKDALHQYYQATASAIDFDNATEAKATMNAWVSDATKGKIPEIVSEINRDHVLFLINAVYFKGEWTSRFNRDLTTKRPFYLSNDIEVQVDMMNQVGDFDFSSYNNFTATRLPYGNGVFSMTVILPPPGSTADDIVHALADGLWTNLANSRLVKKVNLFLPRFKTEVATDLIAPLQALGMKSAFYDETGFHEIANDKIVISDVKHKTFIEVDEKGTEAAAATSIGFQVTSMPMVYDFVVNRPFVFVISESSTGAILFAGKIENPLK